MAEEAAAREGAPKLGTDLADGRNVRRLAARWALEGRFELETAACLGGSEETVFDLALQRHPGTGQVLLTGASLAGALRSHLGDRIGGYFSDEADEVQELFGAAIGNDEGSQSPLVVFDSFFASEVVSEGRDGVGIEPATGTAATGKKFDLELLPPGTEVQVRMELLVEAQEGVEERLLSLLVATLDGLSDGEVALGARTSRGLGRLRCLGWRARRFDLASPTGWKQYLTSRPEEPIAQDEEWKGSPGEAVKGCWTDAELEEVVDRRRRFCAEARLRWERSGVLVHGPGRQPQEPDSIHLRSGDHPVLPGTSLAGALRTRALGICELHCGSESMATEFVESVFGAVHEGKRDAAWASPLRVAESTITEGESLRGGRIRIDRFTGGVLEGFLFEEEPLYGGEACVKLELRQRFEENGQEASEDEESTGADASGRVGLVLLLLKDLMTEHLAVGGTASVGRGIATGAARLDWGDRVLEWDPRKAVGEVERVVLNREVEALCARLAAEVARP